ncbi:rRNA maturation RNase YbeY [Dethiobacter alkaliphilus]|uniref:rRNA maturation RNase YbeY n=1 Tax=Dethiobacter alkaliphilus TaxID=427926 RepID=UPI0037C18ACA
MTVLLNDEQNIPLSSGIVSAMEIITKAALVDHNFPSDAEVSLTLCDDVTIHELNKTWRSVDAPTDVLSFPLLGDMTLKVPPGEELMLGDVIISVERARAQAQEFGHSVEREILYLYVHGLLHLLGYDHLEEEEKREMRSLEEKLLKEVGAGRDEF